MTESDILRKIQALLAKAEGTDNEAEAAAFYAKASEMMLKHAVDEATLRAAAPKGKAARPQVVEWQFATNDSNAKGKLALLTVAAEQNRCRLIIRTIHPRMMALIHPEANKWSQWVYLVGYPDDIEFVKMLYTSLLIQASTSAAVEVRRRYGSASATGAYGYVTSYLAGYARTVEERLEDLKPQLPSKSTALVVLVEQEVDEAVSERFPNLSSAVSRNLSSAAGYYQGQRDGHSADIGITKVGSASRALGTGK